MYENLFFMKYWYFTLTGVGLIAAAIIYYIYRARSHSKFKAKSKQFDAVILGQQKITRATVNADEIENLHAIRPRTYHNKKVLFLEQIPISETLVVEIEQDGGNHNKGNGKKEKNVDLAFLTSLGQQQTPSAPAAEKKTRKRRSRKAKHAVTN